MSFFKIFAPDSQETDEDYVNRLLDDLNDSKKYKEALIDLSSFSRQFRNVIGLKSSSRLVQLLSLSNINDETTCNILKIMCELVRDDSLDSCSNSGYLLEEEDEFLQKVFECLTSKTAQIRGLALTLIKNLLRLQTQKVQLNFAKSGRAQKSLCGLINEKVEMIKTNFMYLLPDLIGDNQDIQQILAFQLMDPLMENINSYQSKEVVPVIIAFLNGNVKMQKLFVETGHLSKLNKLIENRDESVIDLLILLFQSPEASLFRNFVQNAGILKPILKNIQNNKIFSRFIVLLGYIIKGNSELTLSLSNGIGKLISLIIYSKDQQEQKSGLFFIDCYNLKGAKIVAESLCNNDKLINSILLNYTDKITENFAIYSMAYSCLISDIENTRNIFYGKSLVNGKYFITYCLEMISQIPDSSSIILQPALKFLSSIIWESTTVTSYFLTTISSLQRKDRQSSIVFLLSLCIEKDCKNIETQNITCLLLLESLLFKTREPIFEQLINSIKTRVELTLLITNMNKYVDSLKDQSLWNEFVKDMARVIKKNKDNLLNIQSEIKSDLTLQTQINQLTEENSELKLEKEKLSKENEECQNVIKSLEQQNLEIQTIIQTYEKYLNEQNEALKQSNEEKNILNQKLEKLRSKMLNMNDSDNDEFEEKYNNLLTQFNDTKNQMNLDINKLTEENQQLKDKLYSSDATNQLQKENEDFRKQIEQNKKHLDELSHVYEDLQNSKKEINNLIQAKMDLEATLQNQNSNENNINKLIQENNNYKSMVDKLESKLSQLQENRTAENKNIDENNNQQKIIDDLNQKNIKLQKDLDEVKRLREYDNVTFTNNLSEIQKRNKEFEDELISAFDENSVLKKNIEENESIIQQLKNKIKDNKSLQINNETENDILTLTEENTQLNNEVNILTNDKNSLMETIETLKEENKQLNNIIETNKENKNNKYEEKVTKLQELTESQETQISSMTELINNYQEQIQKLKENINLLNSQSQQYSEETSQQLQAKLTKSKEKNQKFKELFVNLENKLQKREQELKRQHDITKQLQQQIKEQNVDEIKSKLNTLEQQLSTNQQELIKITTKYNKTKSSKDILKKSSHTAILNISQLKDQVKQLNEQNDILTQKNHKLNNELSTLTRNHSIIQEKHQSALRLIGELWTRNQSLLEHRDH